MYRIVKESYKNFRKDFSISDSTEDPRYKIMKPYNLLFDYDKWTEAKKNESMDYKKVATFLDYIKNNLSKYPEFKVILWELEARNYFGENYSVLNDQEREEIIKIFQMFLNLTYWN